MFTDDMKSSLDFGLAWNHTGVIAGQHQHIRIEGGVAREGGFPGHGRVRTSSLHSSVLDVGRVPGGQGRSPWV